MLPFVPYDNEPDKIQRFAGVRDEFVGDIVGINFDSYHDHRTGFEFDLTAYGQQIDLVLYNPNNFDQSWNPVWKGKVGMEDSAWVAEMEIPLSQLDTAKRMSRYGVCMSGDGLEGCRKKATGKGKPLPMQVFCTILGNSMVLRD